MKKALYYFGDLRFSIVLFVLFAFFCALATFIESAYNTTCAWALVYGANYFAFIQILLGINVAVGLFKYKMFNAKKLPSLIFHLAFIVILFGSGLTRYMGFEGYMHIRQGANSASVRTDKSFIWVGVLEDGRIYSKEFFKYICELGFLNNFDFGFDYGKNQHVKLEYEGYLIDAKPVFEEDISAKPLLAFMLAKEGERGEEMLFSKGEVRNFGGVNIGFMAQNMQAPFINIDKNLQLISSNPVKYLSMSDAKSALLPANTPVNARLARLYSFDGYNLAIRYASLHAKQVMRGLDMSDNDSFFAWVKKTLIQSLQSTLISSFGDPAKWKGMLAGLKSFAQNERYKKPVISQNALKLLRIKLSQNNVSKTIDLVENGGVVRADLGDKSFFLRWGADNVALPFALHLNKFEMQRYTGSNSPSSYASFVRVINDVKNHEALKNTDSNTTKLSKSKDFDYKIYMNHVLDYKGYRFYQSSYDTDEKGTILSVNKDPGKLLTYLGYIMLLGGMFLNLLNPYSRFSKLAKLVNKDALKNASLALLLCAFFYTPKLHASEVQLSNAHLDKLGLLVVQKMNGRMVPFNTLATQILEKIHGSTSFEGLRPEAVLMLAMLDFNQWSNKPLIKIARRADIRDKICSILGVKPAKYLSFNSFFTKKGEYKLLRYSENASRKSPSIRGVLDKAILKLDERVNVLNMVFSSDLLRIIPIKNDPNHTWVGPVRAMFVLKGKEKATASAFLKQYFSEFMQASVDGNYLKADEALDQLELYQAKEGGMIMPSKSRLLAEVFANKIKIFILLAPIYLLAGLIMLGLIFAKMIYPKIRLKLVMRTAFIINVLCFLGLSLGLGLRAYIAARAPWSNSYESMLFIAWALSLSGIFFAKKSLISLSLTSILAGVFLGVAHLSSLDPQITNLVPVLKSYWLTIHVSVITASYGFLGLCMLLGAFVLILFCLLKEGTPRHERIMQNITEASRINEMSMILGISLLTAGNFLGAVWANESWGRYWSWDSKEVWTLVSILIYAAILHIRLIPSLSKQYTFAVLSMLAFWSVMMTYFGVNYFLSGMHSYAAGGAADIPLGIYLIFFGMIVLIILSSFKKKYSKRM